MHLRGKELLSSVDIYMHKHHQNAEIRCLILKCSWVRRTLRPLA